jgi:hypothetical protein
MFRRMYKYVDITKYMIKIQVDEIEIPWWRDGDTCHVCDRRFFNVGYLVSNVEKEGEVYSNYGITCSEPCAEMLLLQNI